MVLNVVGLTPHLLRHHAPRLAALAGDGFSRPLAGAFPALTCSAQATMLTGVPPAGHGIVGNGWYFRDLAEVMFWRQSNHLVGGEKLWDAARARLPGFTCAQLFWWYNMYAAVDWSVTPRPVYPADGRKLPGLYSNPPDLHRKLEAELGAFPFFHFWGPASDARASRWIAASAGLVFDRHRPTCTLVYLPHLDYSFQSRGPDHPQSLAAVAEVDAMAGDLADHVRGAGGDVLVVSEYGIRAVDGAVPINRILRRHGYLAVRETPLWDDFDAGASRAFAVADHQVAHVYVAGPADTAAVAELLAATPGIDTVLDRPALAAVGLDHPRAGELVAVAEARRWFSYYHWLDDARAPDFARTVDIHRKPGYDPVELFIDPRLRFPRLAVGRRLLKKRLGLRTLMDVIPLTPELVRGSHGRAAADPDHGPVLIASRRDLAREDFAMTDVKSLMLQHWHSSPP